MEMINLILDKWEKLLGAPHIHEEHFKKFAKSNNKQDILLLVLEAPAYFKNTAQYGATIYTPTGRTLIPFVQIGHFVKKKILFTEASHYDVKLNKKFDENKDGITYFLIIRNYCEIFYIIQNDL